MEPGTLACVEQHLGFMVLIVYRLLRKPELDMYCSPCRLNEPISLLILHKSKLYTVNFALVFNRIIVL